ncbi:adenylate kinase [Candidatus Finniella inopinata]|uniref:Adenylate kinase n=1 Tax=Candidatus Finniella inopinata TaxID=1696036 RepID=A0A4V2DZU4_9PROT|nr:adenylate kinase [Candidatus Finniella inopinata]RZI46267.1 adenylate kinase [Candidatus Finniella inopinata]
MILVFLGPPGCGKGTQSQFLKDTHGFCHLSTGDLLRTEVHSQSQLGLQIASTINNGLFVNDQIILDIIKKSLEQAETRDVLFDGFPRSLVQAKALDNVLDEQNLKIDCVVSFSIAEDALVDRITGRFNCVDCGRVYHEKNNKPQVEGICDTCGGKRFVSREDDSKESLEKRLKIYYESTYPLINYYKEKGLLIEIDSSQNLDNVKSQIVSVINRF